ncbi:ABC-F family ATP-binding cassette domain-containing protein [Brucepastera parasyntrophica]|uniref:ABC-F family ATP-binding cassette domain-containing protein n=1 Tax=Brucepastera parasyntrophica TaxID=2880008 RepID=UPI00210B08C5|nr:ABC-F family ATP-binding cassette domain-containing protein [Brucepastera parasyntrophica]ULQ58763.1 ABC-F family ATP-binding cassette domain-containing protein [Brucepastera parasyntrophica]
MNLLSVSGLTKMGREYPLFTGISFGFDEGEKAALIGRNGSGKTTLLNCLAGQISPDAGTIALNREAGISFLPQNPSFNPEDSILDHIFKSESPGLRTIRAYEAVCSRAAAGNSSPRELQLMDELSQKMTAGNLWDYEAQIRSVLARLGITDLEAGMGILSGGMVKKVALARVLIDDTKLLLLDEPTNHLDIDTIAWLEEYLRTTPRSVFMVTHDRYFLDTVCTSIYELEQARLVHYAGNFSQYLEKKAEAEELAVRTDARIESVLRTEREWLLRGPKARGTKAKARIDAIRQMMDRVRPEQESGFSFGVEERRLGGKVLEAKHISKQFGSCAIISDFTHTFKKGERIGVFGENGSGKTTLLNMLTGTLAPDSGSVVPGQNTVFGYYCQNPVFEDTGQTVLDYIREAAEIIRLADGKTVSAARFLESFGFGGKIQFSPLETLSGGERKRVYLIRVLMANPNFLVLDEPTNDFDIYTMSVLESFLNQYSGCLLVVSHDRYFMDRTVESLFVLEEDGRISGFPGSCSDYLLYRDQQAAVKIKEKKDSPPATAGSKAESGPKKKLSYKEQKEFENIESEIEGLETRKIELENLLSGGEKDFSRLGIITAEYDEITGKIGEKYTRWEYLESCGQE